MKVDVIKNVIPIMIECLKYGLFWKKNKNKKIYQFLRCGFIHIKAMEFLKMHLIHELQICFKYMVCGHLNLL